jgi:hypothetical protein
VAKLLLRSTLMKIEEIKHNVKCFKEREKGLLANDYRLLTIIKLLVG